jgi:exopolysaccharide biosynthesis polyprenyl glycosylphosphotransferase
LYTYFRFSRSIKRGIIAVGVGTLFIAVYYMVLFPARFHLLLLFVTAILILILCLLWRAGFGTFKNHIIIPADIILLAPKKSVYRIACDLKRSEMCHLRKVNTYEKSGSDFDSLTDTENLRNPLVIYVAMESMAEDISRVITEFQKAGVYVVDAVSFYESTLKRVPVFLLNSFWFQTPDHFPILNLKLNHFLKRGMDILSASVGLVLGAPLMLISAICIKLESQGPILYRQLRIGLNEETFEVIKLRSMFQDAEENGAVWASEVDPRVTKIGKIIRIMRIDELPQLWNVLKGNMSLIGPRPERPEFIIELGKAIPYFRYRHYVKPGITGWAQVNYKYGASIKDAENKLEYDLYYLKYFSFLLDFQIIRRTIRVVLIGKGAR